MRKNVFIELVREANFREMFITEMGWNNYHGVAELPPIIIDEVEYSFRTIAERSGFQVLQCEVDALPQSAVCKRIDSKLRRNANDYIAIYILKNTEHHQWVAPVRQIEKRDLVTIEYETADKADFLFSKIADLSFANSERTTIIDVKERIQGAFVVNSEKITKEFYTGFKKEHNAFALFISGIDDNLELKNNRNKQWYTSVMLNRLMFCYFIQKKGFLDGNVNYLRDKLAWCQQKQGEDQFFKSFYQGFLVQLFQDGLNTPTHQREFEAVYGKIPYLNGGMFDRHQIEQDYAHIDIADEAFEHLFAFFDKWRWHLDTRISASGKDINPDVLGYIFEQYINDRAQMGAYYTKEDITEYIGRNCILPFLMDKVAHATQDMEKEFRPNSYVWTTLRQSGDRYVYDAVKQGYSPDWQERIPQDIALGIDTTQPGLLERRKEWNRPTAEPWALPTEIWRETIERLQRCEHILHKISAGELIEINDFITYNLDIRQFVQDILTNTPNHKLVAHFYHALQQVTILDPTCGSGAFLFAAMNILEPLYEVCIERMQEFHEQNNKLFVPELEEISHKYRSNIQYFIFKSIILRNLYGVDIMQEATEIAKLRLFLKMVAVVEVDRCAPNLGLDPLPDIDFNIRCGNTLMGYANKTELEHDLTFGDMYANAEFKQLVENEMDKVAMAYDRFKAIQLHQHEDMNSFKIAKQELADRLRELNHVLNQKMYSSNNTVSSSHGGSTYEQWLSSHQPFHWIAEFYQIIQGNRGFDVIIGNPPYLEQRQINYSISAYLTLDSGAVHAFCIERSLILLKNSGAISMIVPLAIVCTQRMIPVQKLLETKNTWYANYAWRPAKLFDAVNRALTIFVSNGKKEDKSHYYTTSYQKWISENRHSLFQLLHYVGYNSERYSFWMPKLTTEIEYEILKTILTHTDRLDYHVFRNGQYRLYYRTTGGLYWKVFTNFPPQFYINGTKGKSSRETSVAFSTEEESLLFVALFSSSTFWWWYTITSNLRDLNPSDLTGFHFPSSIFKDCDLIKISMTYLKDLETNSTLLTREQKGKGTTQTQSFKISSSKPIIDEIDKLLAKHYCFTEEELDFIINYDIKYRVGEGLNNDEE